MWFIHLLGSFFFCSLFQILFYFSFNDENIVAIILLLLPSIIDFALSEIFIYRKRRKKEKERSALIRTPENERIVFNYLRNNNIRLTGYINHEHAAKKMSLMMFEEFLERANNNRNTENKSTPEFNFRQIMDQIRRESGLNLDRLSDDQIINIFPQLEGIRLIDQTNNEQQLKYVHIPEDYILTDIKGFDNIEVYDNGKNYLIKPLKLPSENSLYHTNDATIINKDTIISELHLHYLLTVIDTAIGE